MGKPRPVEFLQATGKLGGGSVILALLCFAITAYEHEKGQSVTASVFGFMTIAFFCFGAYWAWKEERDKGEIAEKRYLDERPNLGMRIVDANGYTAWRSSIDARNEPAHFFIQRLSGRPATSIRFDPIISLKGKFSLHFRQIPFLSLATPERLMEFEVREDSRPPNMKVIAELGNAAFLEYFLKDTPSDVIEYRYIITVRFLDRNAELTQEFVMVFDSKKWRLFIEQKI